MNLWIASGNKYKTQELTDLAVKFLPRFDAITAREAASVVESEPTFAGNARLKAQALVQELITEGHKNFSVLADDSGLCVDLLDGRPGIYSGRYSGHGSNSFGNLEKILKELAEISLELNERTGQYHCSLHFITVFNGEVSQEISVQGQRRGLIAVAPKGTNGYAYDSVFLDPRTFLSYGETTYEEKQKDSHRSRAFVALRSALEQQ